ncbi:MAG: fimbrillin family protein [Tannerellaceae bacterium]|nr:fimbrillin family protein [Tannerellaceae bacterium]
MKSYYWLFIILIACQVCHNRDDGYGVTCLALFNISVAGDGLIKNEFDTDDRVGVFQVDYINGSPGVLGDLLNPGQYNVPYVYRNNEWQTDGEMEILLDDTFSDLYFYFPYDAEIGVDASKRNLSAYPFSVSANQRESIEQSDFLWTKIEQVSSRSPVVNVVVSHIMSRCEINLRFRDLEEIPDDPELVMHNTIEQCTINLRDGSVTPLQYETPIIPHPMKETVSGFDFTYEAILVPQIIEKDTPLFSVMVNNEILIFETDYTIQMKSGKYYVFNMTVSSAISID